MASRRRLKKFGELVRELREGKRISLRKFAKRVGMSPTYLSKVERNEFNPPSEEKIRAIAEALDQDSDEMLALAGRIAEDLPKIIREQPHAMATYVRAASGLSATVIEQLAKQAEKRKQ